MIRAMLETNPLDARECHMRWKSRIAGWCLGLAVLACAGTAAAQTLDLDAHDHGEGETQVLFEDAEFGGFGGPEFKFTEVADQPGMVLGGRGGVLIDGVLTIGGGGYGLINSPKPGTTIGGEAAKLGLGYGGVFFEITMLPDSIVHPTIGSMFAGGGASYQFESRDQDELTTSIFVIDNFASAELNLTEFSRLQLGIDYRAVFGVDLQNLDNADLSGPGAHVMLKFGAF